MEDPAAPAGMVVLTLRCDLAAEAPEKAIWALLPPFRRTRVIVKSIDAEGGDRRLTLLPDPGTDLAQLARDCSSAVEDAFGRQGVRTAWSLRLVDDEGRIYGPHQAS